MSDFKKLFSSESVAIGHPDKICDIISDTIVDAYLQVDPQARVAVETLVTSDLLMLAGEIGSKVSLSEQEIAKLVRAKIRWIGYDNPALGFSYDTVEIINKLHQQSSDIAQGVILDNGEIGAGDQGIIYGYATSDGPNYYPLAKALADEIVYRLTKLRMQNKIWWLKPDMKSQVTIQYFPDNLPCVNTIVVAAMHDETAETKYIKSEVKTIVDAIIAKYAVAGFLQITTDYEYFFNPTGRFVIGGPNGDTGVTGRKIIVDSYGGYSRHGGGAFSGKDYTKVDRSSSYALRHAAKNIVAAGLARICEIQIAYAIGVAEPISINVDTFGTGVKGDTELAKIVDEVFDFRPKAIIERFQLTKPLYQQTAAFGHFNNPETEFSWEKLDEVERLKSYL